MKAFNTKIIALSNQEGGVGKTTSAVNIATFLAITETPTLLIDMDPQANASTGLGVEFNDKTNTIYDVASLTKVMSTVPVIMKLISQKKISLDQEI